MQIQPYVDKLNDSKEFKDFSKQHKDAFVMAGFFVLDFENGKHIHQIDYYVPSKKKVAAFTLDKKIQLQMLDLVHAKTPEKLELKTKVDLETLKGILQDEMHNRNITEDIKKIIAVIQNVEGKKIWNVTCMLSGMELLRAHLEDSTESILKMERVSMLDIIKKVTPDQFKAMQGKSGEAGAVPQQGQIQAQSASQVQVQQPQTLKDLAKEKLKKLDELEKEIEKEKIELQKQTQGKDSKPAKATKPSKKSKK